MATPSKATLITKLEALGFRPPAGASSADLQRLLKQARSLPGVAPERPPCPASPPPAAKMPAAPAERPSFARPLVSPAVPPQAAPRSDHEARPWDPLAGW